jgi:hypothetical protein
MELPKKRIFNIFQIWSTGRRLSLASSLMKFYQFFDISWPNFFEKQSEITHFKSILIRKI